MSAGWMKIFADSPRLGFLSAARDLAAKVANGGTVEQLATWRHLMINNYVNAAVTGLFLVLVLLVVGANLRVWWQVLVGKKQLPLRESPAVPLAVAD
jgi:carbon starvation protein